MPKEVMSRKCEDALVCQGQRKQSVVLNICPKLIVEDRCVCSLATSHLGNFK